MSAAGRAPGAGHPASASSSPSVGRFESFVSFESFDGRRIAFCDEGTGPVVVLLHGFASDARTNWVRPGVAGAIGDAGRRLVLVDARGHGLSDKPHDAASYGDDAMAKDARALLDHLGVEEADVVGYSMGALVAVRLSLLDARVRSLVLGGVGKGQVTRVDPVRANRIADALEAEDKSAVTDRAALAFRNFADATGADRLALGALQRSRWVATSEDSLARMTVPTLVVNAANDAIVGRNRQSLAQVVPGALYREVPGDHLSAVTKPEFAAAIVSFLVGS